MSAKHTASGPTIAIVGPDNDLREALIKLIGKSEGYDSIVVPRRHYGKLADDIIELFARWDAGREVE